MGAVDHLERILIEQVIQEPVHGILDGRKSIMGSMNVVGVILLTVAIYTIQAGNSTGNSTKPTTKPTTIIPTTKPGNSTGNSTKPTTKPTTIKPTTKIGNSTGNSTKPITKQTTVIPTTKPGNITGNSTKPTTQPTTTKPRTKPEFVYTENGVTCSDWGLTDVSHPQECSAAVSYAKSFNSKAIFMSRTDHSDRHKGCFIYDSGAVWFNTHDTGSRSSYVTSICKKGCPNSDGLTGFYHTHDGYWTKDHTLQGSKTKMECANTCTQNCVAFNTYATEEQEQEGEEEEEEDDDEEEGAKEGEQKEKEATSSKGDCYHYSNRSSLITANERQWAVSKAYIKCLGCDCKDLVDPKDEGNCTGSINLHFGKVICYVEQPTSCSDARDSDFYAGEKYSAQACTVGNSANNSTKPTTNSTTIKPTTK